MADRTRTIKTAIVVDPMGSCDVTPKEEIEAHILHYSHVFAPVKMKFYTPLSAWDIKDGTDLVIFDYGGMLPGNSLMEDNSREIIRWAIAHPSSLCIVVSGFTYRNAVEIEMQELGFATLPNVVCDNGYEDEKIPQWFKDQVNPPAAMELNG